MNIEINTLTEWVVGDGDDDRDFAMDRNVQKEWEDPMTILWDMHVSETTGL